MQSLTVFAKVLCARHEPAHLLKNSRCAATDLAPSPTQTVDRGSSKGRNDGGKGRVVVESAAFLFSRISNYSSDRNRGQHVHQRH